MTANAAPATHAPGLQERPEISVVVPLYNEEESLPALWEAVKSALGDGPLSFELLLVDDGSRDATWNVARDIARTDARVRAIRFRRNFGQTPAMSAGIDHAQGRIIVTMDGDLQNDPLDIPMLVGTLCQGYDLVVGWRFDRQDKLLSRKLPSRIANWLIGKVTGVPIKDNGCSLKAYRAEIIKRVPLYSEMHRFIPAMARMSGARIAQVKVRHHARKFGKSKYGLSRTWRVLLDLVTIKTLSAATSSPMRWFTRLAVPLGLAGFTFAGIGMHRLFASGFDAPLMLLGTGLLFVCCGSLMFVTGVLMELIVRTGSMRPGLVGRMTERVV